MRTTENHQVETDSKLYNVLTTHNFINRVKYWYDYIENNDVNAPGAKSEIYMTHKNEAYTTHNN